MTPHPLVVKIMEAVAGYSGVPFDSIWSSRHSTVVVRRARALAYVVAHEHPTLAAISTPELCLMLGKHRGYQDRVKITIAKIESTPWWGRGLAYLREQFSA